MFPIFVYLYNTFHHPTAIPDALVLAQKLSDLGFDEHQIVQALDCLVVHTEVEKSALQVISEASSHAYRYYTQQEQSLLGNELIAQIETLVSAGILNFDQRESLIEQAFSLGESPLSIENFKAILLLLLWTADRGQLALDAINIWEKGRHSLH